MTLVQADLAWEDPEANFDHFEGLLAARDDARAAEGGPVADLVVLPEMFATGFTMRPARLAPDVGQRAEAWLARQAAARGAWMCASTPYRRPGDGAWANRMLLVSPRGRAVYYDKRHRFAMAGEREAYAPGSERPVVAEVRGWRVLLQVCYDLRFPVFSRNVGGDAYDAAVYVANWPTPRREHWRALLRARAIENQAYVVGVNRVGTDGAGLGYSGDSLAVGPDGALDLDLAGANDRVATARWDASYLRAYRNKLPFGRDGDSFVLT